ncbi:hypothetical protein V4F39_04785 [Aquincola sp. MAHUQ-54]|uniref:Uncharacterized protein n=1 Tax=Aquincola agrisoli TaxID=3119538 RepID=A0AAW9QCU1_9BURK
MKRFLCLFAALLLLLGAAALAAAALALQAAPAVVQEAAAIGPADIRRAHALLRQHDPRRLRPGQAGQAVLSQHEVQLLLDQAALRWPGEAAAKVAFFADGARASMSLRLPPGAWASGFGPWVNLVLVLKGTEGLPALAQLQVGRVPVPAWLAAPLLRRALEAYGAEGAWPVQLLQQVSFAPGAVRLAYVWQPDSRQRMLATLLPPAEEARLRAYVEHLAAWTAELDAQAPGGTLALPALLQRVFTLAQQRSADEAAAAHENRAALMAMAFYVSGRGFGAWVADARWRAPRPVLLQGRVDFPQHFLVSAALAVEGGGPLADAIGIYKELLDASDGSGFSFNDIAADRAGALLGARAVREARAVQQALAAGVDERELLPDVSDLPEFLHEAAFRQRYGAVDSPAYEAMRAEIESRLQALPLLH